MRRDVGCDDFERARLNREMVSNKLNTCAYVRVENALAGLPVSGELPDWMPKAEPTSIDLKELEKLAEEETLCYNNKGG